MRNNLKELGSWRFHRPLQSQTLEVVHYFSVMMLKILSKFKFLLCLRAKTSKQVNCKNLQKPVKELLIIKSTIGNP